MPRRQAGLLVVETDGLAQQQSGHHPAQEQQMTLVSGRAVLTEKGDQLSMEPGTGCQGGLGLVSQPHPLMATGPPNNLSPFMMQRVS